MNNLKTRLENGEDITFSNDQTGASIDLSHGRTLGGSIEFKIWKDGAFIHLSKTFKSFQRKLDELIEKYELEEIEKK